MTRTANEPAPGAGRPPRVDAVSLDFYETLVCPRAGRGRGEMLMQYLRSQGLRSDPWEHQVLYEVFERHGVEYDPDLAAPARRRYRRRLAERVFHRLNVEPTAVAEHADAVWRLLGPDSLDVFPEVPGILQRLRQAGLGLAIVSNWQRGLAHFCAELGLLPAVDHVLASAEVGSEKPDAAIFHEACGRLDVAPERVFHVGDRIVDDIEGARGAGLHAILLKRPASSPGERSSSHDCDVTVIDSLDRLPELLGL